MIVNGNAVYFLFLFFHRFRYLLWLVSTSAFIFSYPHQPSLSPYLSYFLQAMKEIATIVSDKCINPETGRPFPISQIERAIQDIHFSYNSGRTAKQQALDVIRALKEKFPIERAQMSLRVVLPGKEGKAAKAQVMEHVAKLEDEDREGEMLVLVSQIRTVCDVLNIVLVYLLPYTPCFTRIH